MSTTHDTCDICCGQEMPDGSPCACGGTGLMQDALKYARLRIMALESQLAAADRVVAAVVAWRDAEIGLDGNEGQFVSEVNAALDAWEKVKETP